MQPGVCRKEIKKWETTNKKPHTDFEVDIYKKALKV